MCINVHGERRIDRRGGLTVTAVIGGVIKKTTFHCRYGQSAVTVNPPLGRCCL